MGARNQVGIGLSYQSGSLCSLATQFQTRFLESILRPIAGLKFSTLPPCDSICVQQCGGAAVGGSDQLAGGQDEHSERAGEGGGLHQQEVSPQQDFFSQSPRPHCPPI
jgi:hypothetical protein